jgi:hypothetical protein
MFQFFFSKLFNFRQKSFKADNKKKLRRIKRFQKTKKNFIDHFVSQNTQEI